ncbi:MAG: hypothetical protein LBL92_05130, partial [Propionibacteriaceae bacterium]|nr:hypothetical protein [Propionibacteriaceae bacterium]
MLGTHSFIWSALFQRAVGFRWFLVGSIVVALFLSVTPIRSAVADDRSVAATADETSLLDKSQYGTINTDPVELVPIILSASTAQWWSESGYESLLEGATSWWTQASNGKVTFSYPQFADVPLVASGQICSGSTTLMRTAALDSLGYPTWESWWNNHSQETLLIIVPEMSGCRSVTSSLGHSAVTLTVSPKTVDPSYYVDGLTHELGHVLGFGHAAAATCPEGTVDVTTDCQWLKKTLTDDQYGDELNIMGNMNYGVGRFGLSGWQKHQIGSLTTSQETTIEVTPGQSIHQRISLVGNQTNGSGIQLVNVIDRTTEGIRQYASEFNPTAGGILIRRIHREDDPTTAKVTPAYDSSILNPAQKSRVTAFQPGDRFIAESGTFTVLITSTGKQTEIIITSNTADFITPASGPDDYSDFSEEATVWDPVST